MRKSLFSNLLHWPGVLETNQSKGADALCGAPRHTLYMRTSFIVSNQNQYFSGNVRFEPQSVFIKSRSAKKLDQGKF